jgi:monovalent cation:H+ antiporter-2, CPA2 family
MERLTASLDPEIYKDKPRINKSWLGRVCYGGFIRACCQHQLARLFMLAVGAAAIGIGFGVAELLGLSFALGAFFAGVVLGESDHGHRAAVELQPLKDVFTALFFIAVGMLFDPSILVRRPLELLTMVMVVVLGKPALL